MKKFLILILISLNLVACSQNNEPKEENNKEVSIEDTTKDLKDANITNEESKDNDINKEDSNIKFEICDEILRYQQDEELYYKLSLNYDVNGNQSVMDFLLLIIH